MYNHFNADIGPLREWNGTKVPDALLAGKRAGKALMVVGILIDGYDLYCSYSADDWQFGENTQRAVGRVAGGWGGAIGGAAIGTAICPVVGTFTGGAVGGLAGSYGGEWIVGWIRRE